MRLISNAIRSHGSIDLPAHGHSMFPFIKEGDICRFVSCDSSALKKGDIVLFHSLSGQLVAHRFYGYHPLRQQHGYLFKGDTNWGSDEPIGPERLIGKLVGIQKRRGFVHMTDVIAILWGKVILRCPFLSLFLKMYLLGVSNKS